MPHHKRGKCQAVLEAWNAAETLDSSGQNRSVSGQLEGGSGCLGLCVRDKASRERCPQSTHQEGQGAGTSEFECIPGTLGSLWRPGSIPKGGIIAEAVQDPREANG